MSCNLLLKSSAIEALACLKKEFMYPPILSNFDSVILKVVGNMTLKKVYARAFTTSRTHSIFSCNRELFIEHHCRKSRNYYLQMGELSDHIFFQSKKR